MVPFPRRFAPFLGFMLALLAPASLHAEQQDIAAAARGVVRVALVATDGSDAYFVGHGSGFAVAPDKVLTNAHVVELAREEKNLVIGVIPSEGTKTYGGRIIAYSPGNDLALIQLEEGSLPVSTFYAGALTDGQRVTAIGYPGTVDRAQGLGLKQLVQPLATVKTSGTISSGRASQSFDTLLHTAPLAAGNSGGPLVDDCGRVLGVNSFGSVSDGNDAEFGFAVSWREVASFLRQAGVNSLHTIVGCKSMAEADAADASLTQREAQVSEQKNRASADAREQALSKARDDAERDVITARENAMAGAAVLLALAVLGLGAGGLFYTQGKEKQATWFLGGGGALLLAALGLFFLKPSFSSIDERVKLPEDKSITSNGAFAWAGDNVCKVDLNRSRLTVSQPNDVGFNWAEGGCVNGETQYVSVGTQWQRATVPDDHNFVSTSQFDPATGTLRVQRWLPDLDTMDKIRALQKDGPIKGCGSDSERLTRIAALQSDMTALLPAQPNERIIYHCQKGRLAPADPAE
ncbi:S1C family serine protease [Sphingobium sp. YR768]|uniref:S1C family serine protease n=1 Tax=Sphingobium sp. YR768 TaxID=1884365 RepID=UPI0008D87D46|nr:serine protease [Sphingobium sp. YR768]SER94568.1 Trypsin-like peptidase domain-containing protein [Sphingobium sp. YR768]